MAIKYVNNFSVGTEITIQGLGYNGIVKEYDVNGVMIVEWKKWKNESYTTPEFWDKDMKKVEPKVKVKTSNKYFEGVEQFKQVVNWWYD